MRTLVDRAAAGVVLGICFAVAGCSSTTAIRPDQLLILTQAAARNAEHAAEVLDASGQRVRVNGTLDKVEITLGPEGPYIFLIFGLPLLTAGTALLATGIVLTKSGARTPKYPLRPAPRVEAGLGSVRVSF